MNPNLYFFPFVSSFLISVALTAFLIWLFKKVPILRKKRISRLGGLAIIISFALAIFFNPHLFIAPELRAILIASFLILIIGLWDDFRELDWKTQFLFQVAVAIFVFIMGVRVEYITNPLGGMFFLDIGKYLLPSLFFGIVWIVLLMNVTNWLDGLDGLSGGVAFLGAVTIFLLSLKPEVNQPPVGIVTMALAGAMLGFLIFNFYPARVMAGTAGSWFMGFILAALSIFAGAKIATALLVMVIPIIDAFWVIGERLRAGNPVFRGGDKKHLHFKLQKIGWSPRKIALFFYTVTFFIAAAALGARAIGKLIAIILVTIVMIAALILLNKKLGRKNAG